MELADVADSKSAGSDTVPVQVRSPAPWKGLLSLDDRPFTKAKIPKQNV